MSKAKGSNAERELLHKFHDLGWGAMRAAGSGSTTIPCVDLLVSNSKQVLAIECKLSTFDKFYIDIDDIEQLKDFAKRFGATPLLGVRFSRTEWTFFDPEILIKTKKNIIMSTDFASSTGTPFGKLVESFKY